MSLASIDAAVAAFEAGSFCIVLDDAGRENEGDLVLPADSITVEQAAFLIRHTSGIICVPMPGERLDALELPQMVPNNTEIYRTAFTVSVDYRHGTTTGVSAADRMTTIRALADPAAQAADFLRPGHIFPLRQREGGVLMRAGHTEATVDLCRLAGRPPVGVLAELMNDDGTMMRLPALTAFGQAHNIPLVTIADMIAHRRVKERLIIRDHESRLNTRYGTLKLIEYRNLIDGTRPAALLFGDVDPDRPVLVRVHVLSGIHDIIGTRSGLESASLDAAFEAIARAGSGVVILVNAHASGGGPTAEPAAERETPTDKEQRLWRETGPGCQILSDLGIRRLRILTDSNYQYSGFEGFGLTEVERVRLLSPKAPEPSAPRA